MALRAGRRMNMSGLGECVPAVVLSGTRLSGSFSLTEWPAAHLADRR